MADDRFITAFVGLLDTARHRVRFHSGGQAPILHFRAEAGTCTRSNPTSFPLAAMPLKSLRPAAALDLAPGDVLALLSDGIFEYRNAAGEQFGESRVEQAIAEHRGLPMAGPRVPSADDRRRIRGRCAAGGRHHDRAGEARGGSARIVRAHLRLAAGAGRIHQRVLRPARREPGPSEHPRPGPRGIVHQHGEVQSGRRAAGRRRHRHPCRRCRGGAHRL